MVRSVISRLDATAEAHPDRAALRWKEGASWSTTTWREYAGRVREIAAGLVALGLEPGRGVVILANNRPEWFLADLGAIAAGGVPAGIYATSTSEQCLYIANHCEAQVAVVETEEHFRVLSAVRDRMPHLRAIVRIEGDGDGDTVLSWRDLLARGGDAEREEVTRRIAALDPQGLCTLIYTSGTTGTPKAVMISHHNAVWVGESIASGYRLTAGENVVCYLPLSHIAEQVVSIYAPMAAGGCTWFAESLEKLGENLREVRPEFFFAVPRVWEKIQSRIQAAGAEAPPLRRKIAAWARRQGLAAGYADQQGRSRPLLAPLAERLVFRKVRERLGLDRARVCATSAAPIARDTLEFFLSLGIPILEVYGMSECTGPTSWSMPDRYRTGSAGFAMPDTELTIAEDGEILMRGPHVCLGYYKDPGATAETIDGEGWIHSGDIGRIDEDGFLWVTDRKKELLVTSGGKNVAPAPIEARLKAIPGIGQAVVLGDRRNFVAALLFLDPERLGTATAAAGSPATTVDEAARCPKLRAWIEGHVEEINRDLARYESVRRFTVLPKPLTLEAGELTPTLKLKRRVVHDHYAGEIEALYGEGPAAG